MSPNFFTAFCPNHIVTNQFLSPLFLNHMVTPHRLAPSSSVASSHIFTSHAHWQICIRMSGIPSKDFQPEGGNCDVKHWEASNIPHTLFLKANIYINSLLILNPSSRTMALGWTQPLTEMSTRNLPCGKGWPVCKADNLTILCYLIVYKMWYPWHVTTLWTPMDNFTFSFLFLFFFI
jgi:hypothetical protein